MTGPAGVDYALRRVHAAENHVAGQLVEIAARHRAEHEVHHVAHDVAGWSRDNLAAIARAAAERNLDLSAEPDEPSRPARITEALATALGRRPEPGLLLLEDLRDLYLMASETSLAWEMLAQLAQAQREPDLLELAARCHPQTLRQVRWANTMIKTVSPQILSAL